MFDKLSPQVDVEKTQQTPNPNNRNIVMIINHVACRDVQARAEPELFSFCLFGELEPKPELAKLDSAVQAQVGAEIG